LTLAVPLLCASGMAQASIPASPVPVVEGFEENLDTFVYDAAPSGAVVAAHVRGRDGGARLLLMQDGQVRELRRTEPDESYSKPVWSPDGSRFAWVHVLPPEVTTGSGARRLQFRGTVQVEAVGGDVVELAGTTDAARVLGWASDTTLVVTRYLPGDLPEERPYFVDLATGESLAVPGTDVQGHMLQVEWLDGSLVYVRSDVRGVEASLRSKELVEVGGDGSSRVLERLDSGLPTALRKVPGVARIAYSLAGTPQERELDLVTGELIVRPPAPALDSPPEAELQDLPTMPYINQRWDTPDDFDGSWACGPTSMVMTVARFGRLAKWPIQVSTPTSHNSDYGAYVAKKYCYKTGVCFDAMELDANGKHQAWGAWGWCTDGSQAYGESMVDYARRHDLQSELYMSPTFAKVQAELNAGKAVALSTQMFGYGHIIAVKGTTSDGRLIVNDPWGNATTDWSGDINGGDAKYTWSMVAAKWYVTVYAPGKPFKASLVSKSCPSSMTSGEEATVSFTVQNDGSASWDSDTYLGTTEPRDRTSPFAVSGKWVSSKRPVQLSATVIPGAKGKLEFAVKAPDVCAAKKYTESFNLLHTGAGWFSDASQGGPADDALSCTIEVQPKAGACADAGSTQDAGTSVPEDAAADSAKEAATDAKATDAKGTDANTVDGAKEASVGEPHDSAAPEASSADAAQSKAGDAGLGQWSTEPEPGCACAAAGRGAGSKAPWLLAPALLLFAAMRRPGRGRRAARLGLTLGTGLAMLLGASESKAERYTQPAGSMSSYIQSFGFKTPTDSQANLDAYTPQAHRQLEAYLLEGASAAAKTGDPVMVAWFAAADASLAPWRLTNCGDYNYDLDYDCPVLPWGDNIWQVGLAVQVSDSYGRAVKAFSETHPNQTPEAVGNAVLENAAQGMTFPAGIGVSGLASAPGEMTAGRHNSYWLSVLLRDMAMSAYLEGPAATDWDCFKTSYPSWCGWYRQPSNWQHYSDVLSMLIVSWNQIQAEWDAAIVDDVIVDDVDTGFTAPAGVSVEGKGGWRGHYSWASATSPAKMTGTWKATLPVAGQWTVSAFIPYANHATASKAKVTVEAQDGAHAATLDESQTGGRFVKLGTYWFGTTAVVRMTNEGGAGEYVGWDAMRFHLVQKAAPDAGVPTEAGAGGTAGAGGAGGSGGTGGSAGDGGTGGSDAGAKDAGSQGGSAGAAGSKADAGGKSDAAAAAEAGVLADAASSADSGAEPGSAGEWGDPGEAGGCAVSATRHPAGASLAALALAMAAARLRRPTRISRRSSRCGRE